MKDDEIKDLMKDNKIEVQDARKTVIKSLFNYLPKSGQDWIIVVSIIGLLIISIADIFIVDPIPLIDEILLPAFTYLLTQYYTSRKNSGK